ncbi:hypothetical protein CTO_1016 [Chlamydia trachomatis A2497]|uniref:Uncharacterized protein n=1 Tax=Chlamydia trachomatis serovar A (strain A2497) TaxID=580047 RepID=G4NPP3_CHLT4|nr:hypothetical protein CTO_1016 [Chlamydia trachomatis A2497]
MIFRDKYSLFLSKSLQFAFLRPFLKHQSGYQ